MDYRTYLKDNSRIDAEDVLTFRREVFADMLVSLVEAEAVFALNDAVADTCMEWNDFFIEVMTDFCVNQAKPSGYVTETNAEWLVHQITRDGHVRSDTELELLVRIIERARTVPEDLSAFALREVAHAVLQGDGQLLRDDSLTPGVIGAPEARLLRRIIYGVGAEGRLAISHAEVEVLFDLNDATVEAENHPEWNDVFVKAVAAHVMMASGYHAPSREEVMRREAWLDDTSVDVSGMLSRTLSSVADMMLNGGFVNALKSTGAEFEESWANANAEKSAEAGVAEQLTRAEAEWLASRIGRDGVLHENERALLLHLKQESVDIDPALKPLLDQVA